MSYRWTVVKMRNDKQAIQEKGEPKIETGGGE
jgi:hypothetical protein